MAYADLAAELAGRLPGLSPILAATFIQRAWREIRDRRLWSFLSTEDIIVCPAVTTTGTLNITQGNNQVTADAAASAALLLVFQNLAANLMQVQLPSGFIYDITALDQTNPAAIVLTFDRVVEDATAATSPYQCFRNHIAPPTSDFVKWDSLVDVANAQPFALNWTAAMLDQIDPQRQSQGRAFRCASYKASTDVPPVQLYELWPVPTEAQYILARYRRIGVDFTLPTDVQPAGIPDALIMNLALLHHAYPHMQANAGLFPAMAKVNWAALITPLREQVFGNPRGGIRGQLRDAIILDENLAETMVRNRGYRLRERLQGAGFPWPIDSNFLQSHLVNF